jgi:hypothetical protein
LVGACVEAVVSPQEEDVGSDTIASFIILFSTENK